MSARGAVGRALAGLRRAAWLVVVVAVVAAVLWARLLRPAPVVSARVERATVVEEVFGRGTVESEREAALGFDLVGRLSRVEVEEGARVTMGQELARLETDQAQADLRSAQTGISAARASLQRIAADEERARAVLATAEREARRTQQLVEGGSLPPQQRDDATDRVRVARADLDRVLAQRSEATRGIDVAAGGAEQRRVAVVRAALLAPFDGIVTRRLRDPGDTVTVGSTVLRIADTRRVYVKAALDETVLHRLAVEQRASVVFPGSPDVIPGVLTRIPWEADRQTHELLVDVTPSAIARRTAIGQRADVKIELGRRERALTIPLGMVMRDAAGAYVGVDRGGRVAVVRPELGIASAAQVEVLSGLGEGDVVLGPARPGEALPVGRRWEAR